MPPKKAISTRRKRTTAWFRRDGLKRLHETWRQDHPEGDFSPEGEPTVTPILKAADGGIARILEALRAYSDDDAKDFVALYDSLSQKDRLHLTLEEIAYAAGVGSLRLAEVAISAMIVSGQMETKMMIASSMHKVTKAIVKAATDEVPITVDIAGSRVVVGHTNGDTKAMDIFGRMSGMIPVPKGANIIINNLPKEEEDEPIDATPAYLDAGERLRLISDAVDPRRLPSPAAEPMEIGGRLDHMQMDIAEAISGDV